LTVHNANYRSLLFVRLHQPGTRPSRDKNVPLGSDCSLSLNDEPTHTLRLVEWLPTTKDAMVDLSIDINGYAVAAKFTG
jgi:hypothetical protein